MDDIKIKRIEYSFQQVINRYNSEIPLCVSPTIIKRYISLTQMVYEIHQDDYHDTFYQIYDCLKT